MKYTSSRKGKWLAWLAVASALLLLFPLSGLCCTSVIISASKSPSGRPLMLKHRDTSKPYNHLEWFCGERYPFIGLVNYDWRTAPVGKDAKAAAEVWSGMNTEGFCIMNTAAYDFNDDDVPLNKMDSEGYLMYRALELCRSISDFETLLDTLSRPLGVEANFGVIDAFGGAAYYEVGNYRKVKFDVNSDEKGYMVVTNFTRTGRVEDRKGVDRFERASEIMESFFTDAFPKGPAPAIIDRISRSGAPISRKITTCSLVFEGVAPGDNPAHAVMWTALGPPESSVAFPVLCCDGYIPSYLSGTSDNGISQLCLDAVRLRYSGVRGAADAVEYRNCSLFNPVWSDWCEGRISDSAFRSYYKYFCNEAWKTYKYVMGPLLR